MEKPKSTSLNVPDIGHTESEQAYCERITREAHRIAERLMTEHFGSEKKKEPVQN